MRFLSLPMAVMWVYEGPGESAGPGPRASTISALTHLDPVCELCTQCHALSQCLTGDVSHSGFGSKYLTPLWAPEACPGRDWNTHGSVVPVPASLPVSAPFSAGLCGILRGPGSAVS